MPIITAIEPQKKNKERVNVYIEGEYAFSVGMETAYHFQMKKGQEISYDALNAAVREDNEKYGFDLAVRYLSYSMRTQKEVEDHLKRKEMDEGVIQQVIQKLAHYNYIDDEQYARAYLTDHLNFGGKSIKLLAYQLGQKGISKETIQSVLSDEDYQKEEENLEHLVKNLMKKNQSLEKRKRNDKIMRSLASKGYQYGQIRPLIEQLGDDIDEE